MQYEVVCTHNRHYAIAVEEQKNSTYYICADAFGVTIKKMPTGVFKKEYSIKADYSVKKAALKFIELSLKGRLHNPSAVLKLKEIIMLENNVTPAEASAVNEALSPTQSQAAAAMQKAAKAEKVKAEKPPKEPKAPVERIGKFCRDAIIAGKTNEEILTEIRAKWPKAKTTEYSLAWYRNDVKRAAKNG